MKFLETIPYDYPFKGLRPGDELHEHIVDQVLKYAKTARDEISTRFASWQEIDRVLNAYIPLDEEEERLQEEDPTKPVSIVFPYTYAIKETLLTYITTALLQDPIFQYEPVSPEDVIGAILLEKKVQLDCTKNKIPLALHVMVSDALTYGVGFVAPTWTQRWGVRRGRSSTSTILDFVTSKFEKEGEGFDLLFEGNKLINIDPYKALPDPTVSIHNVQDGDFFGWVDTVSYYKLLEMERLEGDYFNVKYLQQLEDKRSAIVSGEREIDSALNDLTQRNQVDVIYMYVNLVPSEWGLGDGEYPEKWMFAVAADSVVIMAKPLNLKHGMFPVAACAPDFDGYSVTPLSRLETLYGLQTTVDFLFNSHIKNVRKAINDMLVVDPYLINVRDLKDPKPGKLIRTRRPAWGKGVKDGVMQLVVNDITRSNIADTSWIVQWMNYVSGVDEAMMGALRKGGPERLTGTEFQGTRAAALGRLKRMSDVISLQAMVDIGYFFAYHTQELMSNETYVRATGRWQDVLLKEYGSDFVKVSPEDLDVDFDVVPREGNVPGQQSAQAWIQLLQVLLSNEEVYRTFDIVRIVKHIARELGAKDVEAFVRKTPIEPHLMPDEQVVREAEKGNLRPVGGM